MDVRARLAGEPVVDGLSDVLQAPQLRRQRIGRIRERVDDVVGLGVGDGGMVGEQADAARARHAIASAGAARRCGPAGVTLSASASRVMSARSRPATGPRSFTRTSPAAASRPSTCSTRSLLSARGWVDDVRGRQDRRRQYRRHGCEAPHVPSRDRHGGERSACGSLQNCEPNLPELVAKPAYRRGLSGSAAGGANRVPGRAVGYTPLHVTGRAWRRDAAEDLMAADAGASDLGRYRLGRLLGRGGMGEVYLAHDETLDRDVAIKFVSADKVGDEAAGRRLLHEAHSAAVLDHPCICTVYETGRTPDGQAFIVMQYVEGQPLSTMLQAGPLPVARRPEHRRQHRRGAGRRAPARHRPSRSEAVQRDGHAVRASEAAGLRHRQAGRAAGRRP